MNTVVKVVLNIAGAAGCCSLGYFIGKKRGIAEENERTQWVVDQANEIIENTYKHSEVLLEDSEEKTVVVDDGFSLEKLKKADEIEVPIPPEEVEEVVVPVKRDGGLEKATRISNGKPKTRTRVPKLIDASEYDMHAYTRDHYNLTLTESGDIYLDDSEELFDERDQLGEKNISKMIGEARSGDGDEWYVFNPNSETYYCISYKEDDI